MAIDEKKFKIKLATMFVELLESERGIATKLSKAVGKPSSFINEIKRGKPVNSTHLKAVEIVFGSEKVIELISDKNVYSDIDSRINKQLIDIKNINTELYKKVETYIKGIHDAAMILKK